MPILDSRDGGPPVLYDGSSPRRAAELMRAHALVALQRAGSGHAGGRLSVMDIAAALYLNVLPHDPRRGRFATSRVELGPAATRSRAKTPSPCPERRGTRH
jgi:transketolase